MFSEGDPGLRAAGSNPPDLILLDVMLPEVDGFSVLSEVRKAVDVPVILLTAMAGRENRAAGLDAGADAYITKPFSNTELVAKVKELLAHTYENARE